MLTITLVHQYSITGMYLDIVISKLIFIAGYLAYLQFSTVINNGVAKSFHTLLIVAKNKFLEEKLLVHRVTFFLVFGNYWITSRKAIQNFTSTTSE